MSHSEFMDVGQTSSLPYYYELLSLLKIDWLRQPLLRGFVTSTGTGSESVLRTSRAALSKYLAKLDSTNLVAFAKSLTTLLRDNLTHERLAVPILDSLAFLLQSNVIMTLKPADFRSVDSASLTPSTSSRHLPLYPRPQIAIY